MRRPWVPRRAVWLAAEGRPVPDTAADLGAAQSSVLAWLDAWREHLDPAARWTRRCAPSWRRYPTSRRYRTTG